MNGLSRYLPLVVVGLAGVYLVAAMASRETTGSIELGEAGKIPVVDRGRVKPLDTVARTSLMIISKKQTFVDEAGHEQPAIKWLLDVMAGKEATRKYKVFRIEHLQVLNLLGLEPRPLRWRYAIDEFAPKLARFEKEVERVKKVEPKQRDLFDTKIFELRQHLELYMELSRLVTPLAVPPASKEDQWKSLAQIDEAARQTARQRLWAEAGRQGLDLAKLDKEQLVAKFLSHYERTRSELPPAALSLAEILRSYEAVEADKFNEAVAEHRRQLDRVLPDETGKVDFEASFNHFAPFYHCSALYVVVFLLACLGWMTWGQPLQRAAFFLALFTLALHTWALGARMYLSGRPPVTNLYSSAVWISLGCVIVGVVLEAIFRNGIGTVVAAMTGFPSMLLAHHLAGSGDTLEMMQAVLDTNFWLATHVTVVTFGYVATMVAGALGALYVILGVATPALNKELSKALGQMIYGVVCFATLLSFTGTVLGGIWADQSWGRFWGWDPKENGALIIVLWNALTLHARWGGLVKQRGLAVLAIVGIMVTGWSWIGTNQLGVGLHAYGFSNTLAMILVAVWGISLSLIALGLLPLRWWRSFAAQRQETSADLRRRGWRGAPSMVPLK